MFTLTWCHLEIWQETVELAQRHCSGVRLILSRSEHRTLIHMENDEGNQSSLHSSLAECLLGKLPNTVLFFSFSSLLFKGSPIRNTAQSIPVLCCQEWCGRGRSGLAKVATRSEQPQRDKEGLLLSRDICRDTMIPLLDRMGQQEPLGC